MKELSQAEQAERTGQLFCDQLMSSTHLIVSTDAQGGWIGRKHNLKKSAFVIINLILGDKVRS